MDAWIARRRLIVVKTGMSLGGDGYIKNETGYERTVCI
jgi:hypothetical protein